MQWPRLQGKGVKRSREFSTKLTRHWGVMRVMQKLTEKIDEVEEIRVIEDWHHPICVDQIACEKRAKPLDNPHVSYKLNLFVPHLCSCDVILSTSQRYPLPLNVDVSQQRPHTYPLEACGVYLMGWMSSLTHAKDPNMRCWPNPSFEPSVNFMDAIVVSVTLGANQIQLSMVSPSL